MRFFFKIDYLLTFNEEQTFKDVVKYIELFAGCGGLSLGLQSVGFKLIMANELSPMASESYAYNFFNETLSNNQKPKHTLWLSSNYPLAEMDKRLREDPRTYPPIQNENKYSELNIKNFTGHNLVIGDIKELNKFLACTPDFTKQLKNYDIDLIAGGPPCQSFSMAGLREKDNDRNTLPMEFANFVETIQPKIVLLENVSGILRPFTDKKDPKKKYHAWYEVSKAFAKSGYLPLCLHVNAKYTGVAQNRSRFILIGVRKDYFLSIEKNLNDTEKNIFRSAKDFANYNINEIDNLEFGHLEYWDIEKHFPEFNNSFLKPLATFTDNFYSVKDAIDDLKFSNTKYTKNKYTHHINKTLGITSKTEVIFNHEKRNNSPLIQQRFRLYQILDLLSKDSQKEVNNMLKQNIEILTNKTINELLKHKFLTDSGTLKLFESQEELISSIRRLATKKRTQRALLPKQPAFAALSIPDDACHYDPNELRTLTVREMARIQSFPDNFIFKSKVTTGGQMRRFEVPQYTQVGNAVPPLLGNALGSTIKSLLSLGQ